MVPGDDVKKTLEIKDINGDTPLMFAVKTHNWGAVKALMDLGADMHAKDRSGYTPQMGLAAITDKSIVEQLEQHGIHMLVDEKEHAKKEYDELSKLLESIKESGHILGFTRTILGIESTRMSSRREGYALLENCLKNLPYELHDSTLKKYYTPQNSLIREALDFSLKCLNEKNTHVQHENIIKNHQAGKLTILPVSWPGHALTVLAWNDLLVVCNRGENKLENGISVFKIPEGCGTEAFLQAVMPQHEPSAGQVLKGISAFVDLSQPLLTFPSQDQKHDSCAFVNLKSSLQPLLCFLKLRELKKNHEEEYPVLNSALLEPLSQNGQPIDPLLIVSKYGARKEYKIFTEWMRDRKVKELCSAFSAPQNSSTVKQAYVDMFSAILNEHHGQTRSRKGHLRSVEKINAERKRAIWILTAITQKMTVNEKKEFLRQTLPFSILGDIKAFAWWVQEGADVNMRDPYGATALLRLIETPEELKHTLENIQILKTLGADLDIQKHDYQTAIALATYHNLGGAIDLLTQLGANPNAPCSSDGSTILMLHAKFGSDDKANMLIKLVQCGAQLEAKNQQGDTALICAAKSNKWNAVKVLMKLGADVKAENKNGDTALRFAQHYKNTEMIKILEEAQKNVALKVDQEQPSPVVTPGYRAEVERSTSPTPLPLKDLDSPSFRPSK